MSISAQPTDAAQSPIDRLPRPAPGPNPRVTTEIARTPSDFYLIWTGTSYRYKTQSKMFQTLRLVHEVWTPVSLRSLVLRAAELDPALSGQSIRDIARSHQAARPAAYLLTRRTSAGDYVAVTTIPWPAWDGPRIHEGDVVLDREGCLPAPGVAVRA